MSKKILAAVLIAIMSMTSFTPTVNAEQLKPNTNPADVLTLKIFNPTPPKLLVAPEKPAKPVEQTKPVEPPKPVEYVVVSGDNLTKIAAAHNTAWLRLWQKNLNIANPDVIQVGDKLVIPFNDEQLADRPLPVPAVVAMIAPTAGQVAAPVGGTPRGVVPGNGYDAGYCTWYVKNRRADLPNNLGNANTWYSRAAAQGMAVGHTPRAGAVGTTTRGGLGHVVYVESVNADGSITISEMNYAGLYSQRTRTAAASEFSYIY